MNQLQLYWDFFAPAEGPIVVYANHPGPGFSVVKKFPFEGDFAGHAIDAAEALIREVYSGRLTLKEAKK